MINLNFEQSEATSRNFSKHFNFILVNKVSKKSGRFRCNEKFKILINDLRSLNYYDFSK